MTFKEEQGDLFDLSPEYILCQCISSDLKMGAGIATEFNKRFNTRQLLHNTFSIADTVSMWEDSENKGYVIYEPEHKVLNLITKKCYFEKPTYTTIENALTACKNYILFHNLPQRIAMPKIGCGLDKLEWKKVKKIIKEVFTDTDMEIIIRHLD